MKRKVGKPVKKVTKKPSRRSPPASIADITDLANHVVERVEYLVDGQIESLRRDLAAMFDELAVKMGRAIKDSSAPTGGGVAEDSPQT